MSDKISTAALTPGQKAIIDGIPVLPMGSSFGASPGSEAAPKECGAVVNLRTFNCCCTRPPGHIGWHIDGVCAWPQFSDEAPKGENMRIVRLGPDPFKRTNDDGSPIQTVFYHDFSISQTEIFYCWLARWSKDWPQPQNNTVQGP